MRIKDPIYGEFEIEDVIRELIETDEMQRLKRIHQGGASYLVNPEWNITRYDHSVGTMLLTKKLGGTIEEQIAALLHDISHTAFSHVVDLALNNEEDDYHEVIFKSVVEKSSIPGIISRYGYDYKKILYDNKKWTILEADIPSLCADRIDYTLRDMYTYGYVSKVAVNNFLESLEVISGKIVVNSISSAEWFTNTYYKEVIGFFMNPLNIYSYNILSNIIKTALEREVIKLEDLLEDDDYVFNILKCCDDNKIRKLIDSLNYDVNVIEDEDDYDIHQKNKVRLIDPDVIINGTVFKASERSIIVKMLNEQAVEKFNKGVFIKVI